MEIDLSTHARQLIANIIIAISCSICCFAYVAERRTLLCGKKSFCNCDMEYDCLSVKLLIDFEVINEQYNNGELKMNCY